jgi:SAM-dependent methyltransferase
MNAAPRFDALARIYRWLELVSFGPWLMRARTAFLAEMAGSRALVLGDGDGRFTAQLLRALSALEVDAVDASPAMLAELVRRAGHDRNRVRTFIEDARRFQAPHPPYQILVTHFFLDCLVDDEVAELARRLRDAAAENAVWVVSEFAIPAGIFGWLVARPMVDLLYFAFRLLTGLRVRRLPNHGAALACAGFRLQQEKSWLGGLLLSQLWVCDPKNIQAP